MKRIDDENFDYKKVVKKGYEKCAREYASVRSKSEEPSLDLIFKNLTPNSRILDIGCGSGIPVDLLLSKKYNVTGIDISAKQIDYAKINVPDASFKCMDVMDFNFEKDYWDCIISYYAIFHLKKEEQLLLFKKIYNSLKNGGLILLTLALHDEEPYTEDDFFGAKMFWTNFDFMKYKNIFIEYGFDIIYDSIINHGYNDKFEGPEERHPIIFAKKL